MCDVMHAGISVDHPNNERVSEHAQDEDAHVCDGIDDDHVDRLSKGEGLGVSLPVPR